MSKKLQLLRNQTVFTNKATALTNLKAKLVSAEPQLAAGEPLIASYTDGDNVGILLAISHGDGKNYQIFEGSKLSTGGTLEIPQEVQDAINDAVEGIIGGATGGYDTLGEIETLIKGLQTELDVTQTGAGLETNGSYKHETDSNYINAANSLKEADKLLDTNLKAEEDARIAKDKELEGEFDALSATVTKNKVVAGLGITVNTEGVNTVVSAKVKTDNNALKVDATDGLYVDESALEKYQGSNAIVVSEAQEGVKTISLTIDVTDKVLTQAVSGLKTSLSLNYASGTKKLQLLGNTVGSSNVISEIDATAFVKDGILQNVELVVLNQGTVQNPQGLADGTYLKFTFNTDAGKQDIYVNVTSLIDVYTGGNGIQVSNKEISAVKDPTSEAFLDITSTGIKVSGVQNAINTAKATIDSYTINTKPISGNPVLNGADVAITGYVRSKAENDDLQLEVTDTVNDAFGKLEKAILDNEEVCSKAFDAVAKSVGLNREGMTYVAPSGTYVSGATSVQDADAKLDAAIKAVDNRVTTEVNKAYLDGVVAGNGIAVTEKANNKQTISAKAVAADPIIEVTENGIGTKADASWDCGTY